MQKDNNIIQCSSEWGRKQMAIAIVQYTDNHIVINWDMGRKRDSLFQKIRNAWVNYTIQAFDNRVPKSVIIKQEEIITFEKGFSIHIPLEPMQNYEEAAIIFENFILTYQDGTREEWAFHKKYYFKELKVPLRGILSDQDLPEEDYLLPLQLEPNSTTIKFDIFMRGYLMDKESIPDVLNLFKTINVSRYFRRFLILLEKNGILELYFHDILLLIVEHFSFKVSAFKDLLEVLSEKENSSLMDKYYDNMEVVFLDLLTSKEWRIEAFEMLFSSDLGVALLEKNLEKVESPFFELLETVKKSQVPFSTLIPLLKLLLKKTKYSQGGQLKKFAKNIEKTFLYLLNKTDSEIWWNNYCRFGKLVNDIKRAQLIARFFTQINDRFTNLLENINIITMNEISLYSEDDRNIPDHEPGMPIFYAGLPVHTQFDSYKYQALSVLLQVAKDTNLIEKNVNLILKTIDGLAPSHKNQAFYQLPDAVENKNDGILPIPYYDYDVKEQKYVMRFMGDKLKEERISDFMQNLNDFPDLKAIHDNNKMKANRKIRCILCQAEVMEKDAVKFRDELYCSNCTFYCESCGGIYPIGECAGDVPGKSGKLCQNCHQEMWKYDL